MRHLLHALPGENAHLIADANVRHRLKRVLRLDDGAPLVLCDGDHCTQPVSWHGDRFVPTGAVQVHPGIEPQLHLAAGVLKGERQDWLVEKAAELGVDVFVPLLLDHGVVRALDRTDKRERWQAIADGALEQCGRTWRMQVALPMTLADWLPGPPVHFADETGGASWKALTAQVRREPWRVAVGPEGGWSQSERTLLQQFSAIAITLGPLVLRAETAGLAVAAIARGQS